jgi:hypothetical protein
MFKSRSGNHQGRLEIFLGNGFYHITCNADGVSPIDQFRLDKTGNEYDGQCMLFQNTPGRLEAATLIHFLIYDDKIK